MEQYSCTISIQNLDQELSNASKAQLVQARQQLGYILQAHNLLNCLTVRETVMMPLELKATSYQTAGAMAAQILTAVGLEHRIDDYPEDLSGGQKQRVASPAAHASVFTRALVSTPKIVLADEPTAALDRQYWINNRVEMWLTDAKTCKRPRLHHSPRDSRQSDFRYRRSDYRTQRRKTTYLRKIMVTTTRTQPWMKAVLHTAQGFSPTALPVLSGKIPEGLRGSLYRNGPGRLERGSTRVGHWFDGDGAILAVHFNPQGATGVYRYVETPQFLKEEQAGRLMYSGYGMLPPGGLFERFTKSLKNAANTSVLALNDRLLALWEGAHPYTLNLETLETGQIEDFAGLPESIPFSAHPKRDPKTGDIYNFGISFGKNPILNIHCVDATGKLKRQGRHELEGFPLIHDFAMAGQYLLFFVSPVRSNPLPLLAKLKSFSESFEWKPELGTQVLVFDRETLHLVSQSETDPWYQWHFGNACVDDEGNAIVDIIRLPDFNTNEYLRQVATGETHTSAKSTLWQVRVNPKTGQVLEQQELLDRLCEFPVVNPIEVGEPWRETYFAMHRKNSNLEKDFFGAIGKFDQKTGTLIEADCGENRYPMEPIYAPDAIDPNQGWILTIVYDANTDTSEVWILNCDRLEDQPVCRLALPEVIPPGFHGTWKPAK